MRFLEFLMGDRVSEFEKQEEQLLEQRRDYYTLLEEAKLSGNQDLVPEIEETLKEIDDLLRNTEKNIALIKGINNQINKMPNGTYDLEDISLVKEQLHQAFEIAGAIDPSMAPADVPPVLSMRQGSKKITYFLEDKKCVIETA